MHRSHLTAGSLLALGMALASTPALAQSTGSVDFEQQGIVVSGRTAKSVSGVQLPDTPRAKQVLDQTIIAHQTPGQSVNDIINLVPGVSFQNNDPFGSSGGTLFIRGFDNTRISQTFDGIPLNDTGGYSIYSNQQLDPEVIEQVNVNLGSTDVDSPTAAASGSTVNYRSRIPTEDFHARMLMSMGDFAFARAFGEIDTGNLTASGLRAYVTASNATNDVVYGNYGRISKTQLNGKLYQPIGSNGDFISLAAHYNRNRNNYSGLTPLWNQNTGTAVAGPNTGNRFPQTRAERFYSVSECTVAAARPGVADTANSCSSEYNYRINPSDTENVRMSMRLTLADGLVLTLDPSVQWTSANGGSYGNTGIEGTATIAGVTGITGYTGSAYYFGRDLNGDGDTLDTVRLMAPSQTNTVRLGLISSLRYDIAKGQTIRLAYSYDRGRHRQTGDFSYLNGDGSPSTAFPVHDPITDVNGVPVERRNRLSYAILHQVSGEYRGEFGGLTVNAGLRAPFFKRNLNQYCFTGPNGAVACLNSVAGNAAFAANNPTYAKPQQRVLNYNRVLPSAGFTYSLTPAASVFFNYSKGMQVPGTDNLYNSFYFSTDSAASRTVPETTDNFDLGVRYRTGKLMAQASAWYTIFQNRLASSYDRDLDTTIYRNLGRVDKYGFDGSLAYTASQNLSFYIFGSYLHSKIRDNVQATPCTATNVTLKMLGCTATGQAAYLQTAGKRESAAPVYTFGGRVDGSLGPVSLGVQAKRTGPRYLNDQNLPSYINVNNAPVQVFDAKAPAYTVVDIDAKLALAKVASMFNERTFLQLNVTNVFDEFYVGGFSGTSNSQSTNTTTTNTAQIGAPRTVIATLSFGF